ncbi:MAG TPA: hypothetical protein VGQ39_09140 [Pyrinomonadaceae bacterium]|jgi:hypothetical protein|nr:hypothetical protein [Pyrinomonadaceae bacterium]
MLNTKVLTFAIAVNLFGLLSVGNSSATSLGPNFAVKLSCSEATRSSLKSLDLSIEAPDGTSSWQYAIQDMTDSSDSITPNDWYKSPGTYTFRLAYCLKGKLCNLGLEKQEFLVTGDELQIAADLWFTTDAEERQTFLADLTIKRLIEGEKSVALIQDWSPTPGDLPHYQLVNWTKQPIYGAGWLGNFFGRIQFEGHGTWIRYPRGGFCGTVGLGQPLEPNHSVGSVEGYFIGTPTRFVTGRYKYVIQYSLRPVLEGVPTELMKTRTIRKRTQDIFEVSAEFFIDARAQ